jgi:NAD-dependent DNA ligase
MTTVEEIVHLLKEASDAYYNGGTLMMDDDTYDSLVERLKEINPDHSYLNTVGAPPPGATKLPFPMPSLDKIKPGEDTLKRFLAANHGFVISEKLDGLSALWNPRTEKLYLRGDGIMGQDISHLVHLGIRGLIRGTEILRGEIILPRYETQALRRSWVNGQVHQKSPIQENISKIHFVAYEIMNSRMTRYEQFEWLKKNKYEVPWYVSANTSTVTETQLSEQLITRREVSDYDTDGLVIGFNKAPVSESTDTRARNPKDCVAFKMSLADQSAETTVQEVIWTPSAQGYIIPRLRFDPVVIGSATIEFCTAHNARTILQTKLGPGAKVVIRRSGDVIPKLDRVLTTATQPSFPPVGTWEWDGDVHIKVVGEPVEVTVAKLHYFLKTLEIPGSGPATASALVAANIVGPATLWAATSDTLSKILGPKTGSMLYANLRTTFLKVTESDLMQASSTMPRGVGDTKLSALFKVESDPRNWQNVTAPEAWTTTSFQAFLQELPNYVSWRQKEIHWIPYPILQAATNTKNQIPVCITGFRDKNLEQQAATKGYELVTNLTGKVTLLLVPDGEVKETEKIKTAREKGIRILSRSQFVAQYLS